MERLRIMSANLWATRVDDAAFAERVAHFAPDIVCIRELAPAAADRLADMYPHGELNPATDFRGMGIALTRPAKVSRLELPHKGGLVAALEPADWPALQAPLELVNLHLAAPGPRKILSHHLARRQQLAAFEQYLAAAPDVPRIVLGDLNSTPAWPLYRRLRRHFDDAHRAVAKRYGRLPRRTWGPTDRWPRLLRIDHVLVDRVTVSDLWVVPVPGSDHSGIIFDI